MTLIEALQRAFLTSVSEMTDGIKKGKYYLSLKYSSIEEMHEAYDAILAAVRTASTDMVVSSSDKCSNDVLDRMRNALAVNDKYDPSITSDDMLTQSDELANSIRAFLLVSDNSSSNEMAEVLKLFANKADKWEANHPHRLGGSWRDASAVSHRLGDFRKARSLLVKLGLRQ